MNLSNELISLSNAFARVGCLHRDHLRQTLDRIGFKYITGPRHGRGSLCFVLEELEARLREKAELVAEFRQHLLSPKFSGLDQDGSRKDWIATGDVLRWLAELERE